MQLVPFERDEGVQDKWGVGFWAALQQRLADRNLYQGRVVDQRNDRTIQAARRLLGNP